MDTAYDHYDHYGHYDRSGFNRNGYDQDGYNRDGYDRGGFKRNGYDKEGYNRHGYDRNGYNRDGRNRDGCDMYQKQLHEDIAAASEGGWRSLFALNGYAEDREPVPGHHTWLGARNDWTRTGDPQYLQALLDTVSFNCPPEAPNPATPRHPPLVMQWVTARRNSLAGLNALEWAALVLVLACVIMGLTAAAVFIFV